MKQQYSLMFKLSFCATAFAVCVVVLGAFTRLVDAGLGCPDWPGCYGHLTWPTSAEDVIKAEARFPEAPVEHDKTWPEMVHRYFATGIGLFILGLFYCAWRTRKENRNTPYKLSIFLVGLVILQGAFGAWTVTLKLWPQVVTAHLLGGFATLSLLWLLVQRTSPWHWHLPPHALLKLKSLRSLSLWVMLAVIAQIFLGGWTSTNYAALACPDLPTCHGQWWPEADFVQGFNIFQHVGPNYLGGLLDNDARTAIHLTHRLGAIIVTILVILLAVKLMALKIAQARNMAYVLLAVLILQLSLGLSNVYWALPLSVAVAHNAVGALLLLVLVTLNHRIHTVKEKESE